MKKMSDKKTDRKVTDQRKVTRPVKFPKTRLQWLWENMEGKHGLFKLAIAGK